MSNIEKKNRKQYLVPCRKIRGILIINLLNFVWFNNKISKHQIKVVFLKSNFILCTGNNQYAKGGTFMNCMDD